MPKQTTNIIEWSNIKNHTQSTKWFSRLKGALYQPATRKSLSSSLRQQFWSQFLFFQPASHWETYEWITCMFVKLFWSLLRQVHFSIYFILQGDALETNPLNQLFLPQILIKPFSSYFSSPVSHIYIEH